MTRYENLLAIGRQMSSAERRLALVRLAQHEQFAALLAELQIRWEGYGLAIGQQKLAPHHGCLEHCAGSMYALEEFKSILQSAADPKKPH